MKVILLKDVSKVGQQYEVKEVSSGYALNFLIPKGFAKVASPDEVKRIEKIKAEKAKQKEKELTELKEKLAKVSKGNIELQYQANEKGHLFKGIGKEDIAKALEEKGVKVDPQYIVLDTPIKEVGEHEVEIKIGKEKAKLNLKVVAVS